MVSRDLILDWVQSVPSAPPPSAADDIDIDTRGGKRRRVDRGDGNHHSTAAMPKTPPSTDASTSVALSSRKRPLDKVDDADGANVTADADADTNALNATPKASTQSGRLSRTHASKKIKYQPIKTILGLQTLERPVRYVSFDNHTPLPSDIEPLYQKLREAEGRVGILPSILRKQIQHEFTHPVFDHNFDTPSSAETRIISESSASVYHARICEVHRAAVLSEKLRRHELGWNNHVYTDLLKLVFGSPSSPEEELRSQQRGVQARAEAVMSATIAGNSLPAVQDDQHHALACSISQNSSDRESLAETTAESASASDADPVELVHSRSGSKKVDYVVVLDVAEDQPFYDTIRRASFTHAGKLHVNQTEYAPIEMSPIAMSIETKANSTAEACVQLGIWTASWYQRMYALQRGIDSRRISLWSATSGDRPTSLVSVPLVIVERHKWSLYFACDADLGASIAILGPIVLGDTSSLIGTYAIATCLGYIKDWIETTFYESLKVWFRLSTTI
ncbi:hypothetical protein F5Y18DRAFT_34113 [Xylariaceae sp. FL1019]|nr:hypothetical protein F5Y18DRAFT_34113 [Xylariaceae sp. FL1019]